MKKKILVVDDYPIFLKYMKHLLEKEGHEVRAATDGLSAIDILETFIPDVVFIDLIMPNISGEKLCHVIRKIPQMRDACIVILSAIAAEEDFDFAAIGANACIAKGPLDTMSKPILEVVDQSYHLRMRSDATKVLGLENVCKRKITAELLAIKKHFEAVLDHMSEGIVELTRAGKIIMLNPAATAIMNDSEEKLLGIAFTEVFDKVDQKKIESYIQSAKAERPTGLRDFTVELNKRKISLKIMPVEGEEDWSFVVILLDITEAQQARDALQEAHSKLEQRVKQRTVDLEASNSNLKIEIEERIKAEAALRESEEKYRTILEDMEEGYYEVDLSGNFTFINDAMSKISGQSRDELVGMNNRDYMNPETAKAVYKSFNKVYTTGNPAKNLEWETLRADGSKRYVESSVDLMRSSEGQTIGFRGVVRDVTARKSMAEELKQAHKMEAIGTLAGGIAHEFNNILGIIIGNTELGLMDVPDWNPAKDCLEEIRKASLRAKDVVRQIMSFARKTPFQRKPLQISTVIKEALKLMRSTIPTIIEIRQTISCESEMILAVPTEISQIFMNLCTNSAHAMDEGAGVLEVDLKVVSLDDDSAGQYEDLKSGNFVKLTVKDTGHGIKPEIMDQIFDPYFTTKDVDEGLGMGLAVVHGIVKKHDGAIKVSSEIGKGTVVEVLFPLIKETVELEFIEESVDLPGGTECILFVDDEEALVKTVQLMLERIGYEVVTKTNPMEVLALFKTEPDRFDLVITDMAMPQLTGDRLAQELMKIRKDIPVILCTGHSARMDEDRAKELGLAAYVMKPLVMKDFANTVRKVLDAAKNSTQD